MSLKNYIFSSINTKGLQDSEKFATLRRKHIKRRQPTIAEMNEDDSNASEPTTRNAQLPQVRSAQSRDSNAHAFRIKRLFKFWRYISVEILMFCWLLPSCFLYIAIENLALEKSCRVNFGYSDEICDNMIDKSLNKIDCVKVRLKLQQSNEIHLVRNEVFNDTHFLNGSEIIEGRENATIFFDVTRLELDVCRAEVDSQKLDTKLNFYTAPFDSVFGIIMILFAGGWSDKHGRRKPCMLLPLLGELAGLLVLLFAAVFFKQLPLEFSSILVKLLPAIAGGANLMLMGVYSYLSETTAEEDRTFRFGVFAQIVPLIPIVSLPFSGILFKKLGYIKLITCCIPINIIGIFYIIFILKEVKRNKPTNNDGGGIDNPGFDSVRETANGDDVLHIRENQNGTRNSLQMTEEKKTNFLVDFFNPVVAVQCMKVIMRKRENQGRATIILLFVMYFIAIGPAFGEEPNEYNFTRIQFNWDGTVYSTFATYGIALSLVGTIFMVAVLSKIFKCSDPFLGLLGTTLSCVSKILYTSAKTLLMMYVARTFDAFISIRALVLKSILSKYVEADELGRAFSIIAIVEAIGKFIFVSLYSIIYELTLETWPAAFYFCSLLFLVITVVLFVILYFIVKRKQKFDALQKIEMINDRAKEHVNGAESTHI